MDAAGNLYGTTYKDGAYGSGSVFKLIPSNGGWTYTDLHDFSSGSDGAEPVSNVILDANGNLYGTALAAGGYGYGIVFEIMPLADHDHFVASGHGQYSLQCNLVRHGRPSHPTLGASS